MNLTISCDSCSRRASVACGDCVVTFLAAPPTEFTVDELAVLDLLVKAGMVPSLRHCEAA